LNGPVSLVYWETQPNKISALRREREIKKYSHLQKKSLVSEWYPQMSSQNPTTQYEYLSIAPGRVNLLGEHIDYNGGSVLPAAIDRNVHLFANPRPEGIVSLTATDLAETISFRLDNLEEKMDLNGNPLPEWALFPAGVAWVAQKHGYAVSGLEGEFTSNIPMGSGLSSSAAVEVAFAALWRELNDWPMDNLELSILCQQAENQYVGVNCGLMDQFSVANGIEHAALLFDTQSHEWQPVYIPTNVAIVIADSKKRRSLSTSAYNERREACEHALALLKQDLPDINTLNDVSLTDFETYGHKLPPTIYKRAKHVVEECHRVKQAAACLNEGDVKKFGEFMFAGHASLRDLYEVSIPELDTLVALASQIDGCYGARLSGAGFGDIYLCQASQGVIVKWHERAD
jgi:galactokinase